MRETDTAVSDDVALREARSRALVAALWWWTLAILVPCVELGLPDALTIAASLAFPLAVAGGLGLLARVRTRRAAEVLMLAVAPASLALAVTLRPEVSTQEVAGPVWLALLVGGGVIYAGVMARLLALTLPQRSSRTQPLATPVAVAGPDARSRRVRALLVGVSLLASGALVAYAPIAHDRATRLNRNGPDGTETFTTLAGAVGVAVSLAMMLAVVAPAMRAPSAPARISRGWTSARLALAVAALLTYWVVLREG